MVSLSDDGRRSGGYFFDEQDMASSSVNRADSDELLIDSTSLGANEERKFRTINTPFTIVLMILLVVAMGVSAVLLPFMCSDTPAQSSCGIPAFSIIVYCHASLWFIFMVCDRYLRRQHAVSRTYGYLDFYRKTKLIRRTPLMVLSGGNALLLVLIMILNTYCKEASETTGSCGSLPLKRDNFLQIVIAIEAVIILCTLIVYFVWTVKFNRSQKGPDVNQDDVIGHFLQNHTQYSEIGFRDDNFLDDILEKQADMIRYLKQHNACLGKKILKLTAELNHRPRSQNT